MQAALAAQAEAKRKAALKKQREEQKRREEEDRKREEERAWAEAQQKMEEMAPTPLRSSVVGCRYRHFCSMRHGHCLLMNACLRVCVCT